MNARIRGASVYSIHRPLRNANAYAVDLAECIRVKSLTVLGKAHLGASFEFSKTAQRSTRRRGPPALGDQPGRSRRGCRCPRAGAPLCCSALAKGPHFVSPPCERGWWSMASARMLQIPLVFKPRHQMRPPVVSPPCEGGLGGGWSMAGARMTQIPLVLEP